VLGISYALWGAVFGWMLMPRMRGAKTVVASRVSAYFLALMLALFVNHFFHFQRQVFLFLLGMAAQSGILCVIRFAGKLRTRLSK
jgi:hypothetical protein